MWSSLHKYWLVIAIIAASAAMFGAIWANGHSRMALLTVAMVPDLFADMPMSVLKIVGEEPLREEVTIPGPHGPIVADVYRPADADSHGAMVIAVGAAPRIRDHPGVIRLSQAGARAGLVVMIPELHYPFRQGELPDDAMTLVAAFRRDVQELVVSYQWLIAQPYVDQKRSGFFGASAGGGLALVAAADPRISDEVGFCASIGTYYDMVDLFSAITTESIQYGGEVMTWKPWLGTSRILHRSMIHYLSEEFDRELLTAVFLRGENPSAVDLANLSSEGRGVYDVLQSGDPDSILNLWNQVSPGDVATLKEVSPSTVISELNTELFVLHDRADPYIPYVESRRLRDAAQEMGLVLHYAEFDIFNHVEPNKWTDPMTFLANILKLSYYSWLLLQRVL